MRIQSAKVFGGDQSQKQINKIGSKFAKQSGVVDPVTAKKDSAKKRALKIVGDAFSNERKIDNDITSRREMIGELLNKIGDARKSIGALEKSRAELRDFY